MSDEFFVVCEKHGETPGLVIYHYGETARKIHRCRICSYDDIPVPQLKINCDTHGWSQALTFDYGLEIGCIECAKAGLPDERLKRLNARELHPRLRVY